jgi:RNA polymerase sigma-70 factor, ECF subfamily
MPGSDAQRAVAEAWKNEAPRLIGVLTRMLRDVNRAEDVAHEALVMALQEWPRAGVPDRAGAWLMTVAKNRALNLLRHEKMSGKKHIELGRESESVVPLEASEAALEAGLGEDVADDVLRLVFIACHPLLSKDGRVALTLRLLGGLSTDEIARAFLTSEATIAQRIVRAKRTLSEAGVPFELPPPAELAERLASVLEVVYLIFNEGYAATAGEEVMRPDLQREAVRLGQLLSGLAPEEPEVLGLLALMELHGSRAGARTSPDGEPILLDNQDRARWDRAAIDRGLRALARATALGGEPGPYRLQASIAACHARARTAEETDWAAIVASYRQLLERHPSPVVALNHAIAVSRAEGPAAGLALLDALAATDALAGYHLLPSARADLLERLGRHDEARAEFERAATLTTNARQKKRLLDRAAAPPRPRD